MKKTTVSTNRLFVILLTVVLALNIGAISVAAQLGYLGKATMFKGKIETLGVVSENPQITFIFEDESVGKYADFTTEESSDFPILDNVVYIGDGRWWDISADRGATMAHSFNITTEYGEAENLRCHLDVSGNGQLAPCIRVGITLGYPSGECKQAILNGFTDEGEDISVAPYSIDIGTVSADEPVRVDACIWVDKTALAEAGIYKNSEMEVSLVVY